MPNIGHTLIQATGSPQDLAALAAHVRSTARDGSAFTVSALMHPDPAPDHAVRRTELKVTDTMVSLSIGITYDRDSLGVAARIANRFPTLRIVAVFAAECDQTAFDALCFAKGALAYEAHFDDDNICFPVPASEPDGRRRSPARLFQRTPARSAAALGRGKRKHLLRDVPCRFLVHPVPQVRHRQRKPQAVRRDQHDAYVRLRFAYALHQRPCSRPGREQHHVRAFDHVVVSVRR